MSTDELKQRILDVLPRDLVIDLWDVATARARQAHELVVNHTDLQGRSARGLEGQARFRLMEKGFEETCAMHGGARLDGDIIPGTELRYFQPFMRFGSDSPGVLLGLASMPAPREVPPPNKSRKAGVTLNYSLTPRLDLDDGHAIAKPGDVFVLLLFARDPSRAGYVEEIAIGVVDSDYSAFLFYESVELFLSGYSDPDKGPKTGGDDRDPAGGSPLVRLKRNRRPFEAPGGSGSDDKSGTGE